MKKYPHSLIIGIAAVLVTAILFFVIVGFDDLEAIHYVALSALIIAEGITTVYAVTAKGDPRRVAASTLSGIAVVYTLILSFVFIGEYADEIARFIGLYCIGLILMNALGLTLIFFQKNSAADNSRLQKSKSNILYLRKLVKVMMTEPAAQPHLEKLRVIDEKLHFTNDAVIVAEDEGIYQMLIQLQNNLDAPGFPIAEHLDAIEKKIDRRSIMASRTV